MEDPRDAGKISNLPPLDIATGDELMEVVARDRSGELVNYRMLISKIRTNAGLSAYELAVKNGFEGTEQDWLKSLEGQSAYQLWRQQPGNSGKTEEQFLASLRGETGPRGPMGYEGPKGEQGDRGFTGDDGKSAYQTWLELPGNAGKTEAQFIESLKGEPGPKGEQGEVGPEGPPGETGPRGLQGEPGPEGTPGTNGTDGQSAYQLWLTQPGNAGKTEEEFLASLKGDDSESAYEKAKEYGYQGTEAEFYKGLIDSKSGGAVFITDITAQKAEDNVGNKVYDADGVSLLSCSTTTSDVYVTVLAMTGSAHYRPIVKVNGIDVPLDIKGNAPMFAGTVAVVLPPDNALKAEHLDGAEWSVAVTKDTPPVVLASTFTGGYPVGQTELKSGDLYSISFTTDVPVVAYEIDNFGAFIAREETITPTTTMTIPSLVIADRGTVTQALGYKLRVKKASGAWSNWFQSTTTGTVDNVNTVKLNNLYPTITFGAITYPANQTALKDTEAATVNHVIANHTAVVYTSTELTIGSPAVYAPAKQVNRLSGNYNVTVNNFNVKATRAANGAITEKGTLVAIANTVPQITVTTPAVRLRSGGAFGTTVQRHKITLTSNQELIGPVTLNAPEGTWDTAPFVTTGNNSVWTRDLLVSDTNAKGGFTWNSLSAKSRSGKAVTSLTGNANYTLGGFVFRVLTVAAYPNRETVIGTQVSDTSKLRCTNMSKGDSGSLNDIYASTLVNGLNLYTITGPTGVLNTTGNLWYNLDIANAISNTSGTMRIELEEVV